MSTQTPATAGTARRPLGLDVPEPIVLMILAATLGAIVVLAAPPGTDFAAHDYQSAVFARHGFALWDNHWYAGRYAFVTYSLLYYPLAGLLGMSVVAIATVALSTWAFATVAGQEWGSPARWAARTFAVVWPAFLLTAAYPFTLGALLALRTFRALQRGRAGIA